MGKWSEKLRAGLVDVRLEGGNGQVERSCGVRGRGVWDGVWGGEKGMSMGIEKEGWFAVPVLAALDVPT